MSTWKVTLPGEEYLFEPDELMGSEWGQLEAETGMNFDDWLQAIDERRWIPCQVLIWFLRQKAGKQAERRDTDFKIRQLGLAKIPDPKDPEATEPTEPDTSSPSSGEESAPPTGPV